MAGRSRETLSESDSEDNLKGLDDLDDELFGSSLWKSQTNAPKAKNDGSFSEKHSKIKSKRVDDFNVEDPLAGLLSDDDDDETATKKTEQRIQGTEDIYSTKKDSKSSFKKQSKVAVSEGVAVVTNDKHKDSIQIGDDVFASSRKPKTSIRGEREKRKLASDTDFDDSFDLIGGLGLDDSSALMNKKKNSAPSSPVKGHSFMDDLLGRSKDDEKTKEKKTEFVLGADYKNSSAKEKDTDDMQFGSYIPSSTVNKSTRRTVRFGDEVGESHTSDNRTSEQFHEDVKVNSGSAHRILSNNKVRDSESKSWDLLKHDNKGDFDAYGPLSKENLEDKKKLESDWLGLGETSIGRRSSSGRNKSFDWLNSSDSQKETKSPVKSIMTAQSKNTYDSSGLLEVSSRPDPGESKESLKQKTSNVDMPQDTESDWLSLKEKLTSRSRHTPVNEKSETEIIKQSKQQIKAETEAPLMPNNSVSSFTGSNIQANAVSDQLINLQGVLTGLQAERAQLLKSMETLQNRHQEELKSVENFHQAQMKSFQDSCYQREKRLQEDFDLKIKELESKMQQIGTEKIDLVTNYQQKLEKQELERRQEVQRLKEIQSQVIASLKQEHEDALIRLRQLKDQEVEAISSTQIYTRSLQNLTEQLETQAAELSLLQQKVDDKNQNALHERQALLEAKDKQLKALESRLHKKLEDSEEERSHLHQLVLRLENRLQQQTKELEEEHWQLQQQSAKLEVQQRALAEEKKQMKDQMAREREKVERAKDAILQEQKTVLLQLAQDRQLMGAERAEMDLVLRKRQEEDSRINSRKLQDEVNFESLRRSLHQEEEKIRLDRDQLKQEQIWIQHERENFEHEHQHIREEKEKLHDLGMQLKQRSEEVEEMCISATQAREEGKLALKAARQSEMEQKRQAAQVVSQLQAALEKERQILQEQEKLVTERRNLELKKDSVICASCRLSLNHPIAVLPPPMTSPLRITSVADDNSKLLNSTNDPTLLVWQITAKKDKEFLEEEGSFLHSLRRNGIQELKEMG